MKCPSEIQQENKNVLSCRSTHRIPLCNECHFIGVRIVIVRQIVNYSTHKFLNLLLTTGKKIMSEHSLYGVVSK